ncbi:MAG: ribonuclease H family protein, partial [Bacteroidota bacterium]
EFQKLVDQWLLDIAEAAGFLDDIIIITVGTEEEHKKIAEKVLARLQEKGVRLNFEKCEFFKDSVNWLGYKIDQSGYAPLEDKTKEIVNMKPPKDIQGIRSFLGGVQYLSRFVQNLSILTEPIRKMLKKDQSFEWGQAQQHSFNLIKEQLIKPKILTHFNPSLDTVVVCDACKLGLGATLLQKHGTLPDGKDDLRVVFYASRYLNKFESEYSTSELEMLGVVWSLEHFKHYIFGKKISIYTDHQALVSILNGKNINGKQACNRLTRWLSRLLLFDFIVYHKPGKDMGLVDYLSRHPNGPPEKSDPYDEEFVINKISEINDEILSRIDCDFILEQVIQQSHLSVAKGPTVNMVREPAKIKDFHKSEVGLRPAVNSQRAMRSAASNENAASLSRNKLHSVVSSIKECDKAIVNKIMADDNSNQNFTQQELDRAIGETNYGAMAGAGVSSEDPDLTEMVNQPQFNCFAPFIINDPTLWAYRLYRVKMQGGELVPDHSRELLEISYSK